MIERKYVADPQKLRIVTKLNDQVMQDCGTDNMIFPVAKIISELTQGTTLLKGTIILTGTPAGVGMARKPPIYLKRGDVVHIEIDGLGVLINQVVEQV